MKPYPFVNVRLGPEMGSGCADSTVSEPAQHFRASPGGVTPAALFMSMCPSSLCEPDAWRNKRY